MSAATVALQTDDVANLIFEELAIEKYARRYKRRRRRDLARLAHVCRAFVGPALRVLWRVLPGLEPLLRLLSCVDDSDEDELFFVLKNSTIIPEEWQRLRHYARYVQVIDTTDASHPDCGPAQSTWYPLQEVVDADLAQFLLSSSAGEPLFPSLRRLSWFPKSRASTTFSFLISHSVRWLTLEYNPRDEPRTRHLESILTAGSSAMPNLETLTLSEYTVEEVESLSPDAHPQLTEGSLSAISKWMCLRRLTITGLGLDDPFLHTLSLLPRLSSLRLSFWSTVPGSEVLIQSRCSLAALETLELTAEGVDLGAFCNHVSLPQLHKLSLHSDYSDTLHWLFTAERWIGRFPWSAWASTLAILRVWIDHDWKRILPVENCLQPLLCLHGLEEFSLRTPHTNVALSDRDVLSISQSWPKLTALSLTSNVPFPDHQEHAQLPSYMALQHLAEHCPNLRQIALPAIIDGQDVDYNLLPVTHPHDGLRILLIGQLPSLEYFDSFALYLLRLFPGLQVNRRPVDLGVRFPYHKYYDRDLWQILRELKQKAAG